MTNISYDECYPPFTKDFKKLTKRYRSLPEDFALAKKATIELFHAVPPIDNHSIEKIEGLCSDRVWLCKIRKIACRSLKGKGVNSGLRVIYSFEQNMRHVTFIEIYFKGDKANENRGRIKDFLKKDSLFGCII